MIFRLSIFIFLYTVCTSALAATQKLEVAIDKLRLQEQEARHVLSILHRLQIESKKISTQKNQLHRKISGLRQQLTVTQKNLDASSADLNQQKLQIAKRLRFVVHQDPFSWIRMLGSSQNKSLHIKIINLAMERDLKSLEGISILQKQNLVSKADLQNQIAELSEHSAQFRKKENSFWLAIQLRQRITQKIRNEKHSLVTFLEKTAIEDKDFIQQKEEVLRLLQQPSFLEQRGELTWPAKGAVVKNSIDEDILSFPGAFIAAKPGTEVLSIFDGDIAFVGFIDGWGQTVIVDHGDHFYSIYSQIQKPLVTENNKVKKHQRIALAGADIFSKTSGIYFEIRHFSEPNDLSQWMKGKPL